MKLCPYNRFLEKQHYTQKNSLNDDGTQTGHEYDMRIEFVPMPCAEENCGAFWDGRCHFGERKDSV